MAARQLHLLRCNLPENQQQRKRRIYRRQLDPLGTYTDSELRSRYRFGREAIQYIVGLIADDTAPQTNRNRAVPVVMQALITLRFLASGSFLQVVGDTFQGFDKSTVSRVVCRVTKALTAKLGDFIKFPSTRGERDEIKQGLFRVGGFPCAIGFIDGTDVRIKAPLENEPDFVNRKGFHSINVQAICDQVCVALIICIAKVTFRLTQALLYLLSHMYLRYYFFPNMSRETEEFRCETVRLFCHVRRNVRVIGLNKACDQSFDSKIYACTQFTMKRTERID